MSSRRYSSPKRRHILASFNQPNPELEPGPCAPESASTTPPKPRSRKRQADPSEDEDRSSSRKRRRKSTSTQFRFKSSSSSSKKSSRSSRHRHRDRSQDCEPGLALEPEPARENEPQHTRKKSHRRKHQRNHHRRHRSRSPANLPDPHETTPLDPDAAFRESLFDAMADDEGALYWEAVYGQPIHVYAKPNSNSQRNPTNDTTAHMDDEEYAAYVRQKMWEKTHQGLLEERANRDNLRAERERRREEARRLTQEMEDQLRRADELTMACAARNRWKEYVEAWASWDNEVESMRWPVRSGRSQDLSQQNVRDFVVSGLDRGEIGESEYVAKLKEERVRWHPDKMQQKLGAGFDDQVREHVTAVFQIIDDMWNEARRKL